MERTFKYELRRWCPLAFTHQPADEPNCHWDDHNHLLRLRRMYVCDICEQAYFKKELFEDHECFDFY